MAGLQSFPLGQYKLGDPVDAHGGLTEFTPEEYSIIGRSFEKEVIYNAPPLTFMGRSWKLMIGAVAGRIYKLAPYLELNCENDANSVTTEALKSCTERLGMPSSQGRGFTSWNGDDGNAVLRTGAMPGLYEVDLFLTSSSVATSNPGFQQEAAWAKRFAERVHLGTKASGQYDDVRRTLLVGFTDELNNPDLGAAFIAYVFCEPPETERTRILFTEHGGHIERRVREILMGDKDLKDLTAFGLFLALWVCFANGGRDRRDAIMRSNIFRSFGPFTSGTETRGKWKSLDECLEGCEKLVHKLQKRYATTK